MLYNYVMTKKTIEEFIYQYETKHDYFICHEILEDAWKQEVIPRTYKCGYIVLLQVAVAMEHWRNKNFNGAIKLIKSSLKNANSLAKNELEKYFNLEKLFQVINLIYKEVIIHNQYHHIPLPTPIR